MSIRLGLLFLLAALAGCGSDSVGLPPDATGVSAGVSTGAWLVERPFREETDDWEPTIAADPVAPFVYMVTTRYGGTPACERACPDPALVLRVSSDGGATFGPESFLCACEGLPAQNDPQLAVAADGTVYAAWLAGYVPGVVLQKSTDHGRTWTPPKRLMGRLPWSDKPALAISATGRDVYVAFNTSDSYVVSSHDFGETFSAPVRTNADERYYFAYGGVVLPDGTVTFSETSYTQSSTGPVQVQAIRSRDGGGAWDQVLVDIVEEQPDCGGDECPDDFLGPAAAIAADRRGDLVIVYNGALVPRGPQRIFTRRSTDGGATWSPRVDLSPPIARVNSAFPASAAWSTGDFRIWYMDDRNGTGSWNVWFRRSRDGGRTWSRETRLSNARGGAPYKDREGFDLPYGDYGGLAVTNSGATIANWGEGLSYIGPGGTWVNGTVGSTPDDVLDVFTPERPRAPEGSGRRREKKREREGPRPLRVREPD